MSSQVSQGLLGSQGWLGAPEGSSKPFHGPMKLPCPPCKGQRAGAEAARSSRCVPHLFWGTILPSISWYVRRRKSWSINYPLQDA